MKRILLFSFLVIVSLSLSAAVKITAQAPAHVGVGDEFRLSYVVNSSDVSGAPHISSIPGFDIVYGPATSNYSSTSVVNGRVSKTASVTFTYTLIARKEGTFTLPAVTLQVEGRSCTSNRPRITVGKASSAQSRQSTGGSGGSSSVSLPPRGSASSGRISPQDLYIEVSANKKVVYEQEPVLLSYRVYTNLMLEQLQGKMPDLKGFVAKEVPLPRQKQLTVANHNGRTVQTTTWSQYVMFPQQSGKLTIPSIPFEGVIALPNHNVDPIDAFFFGSNPVTRINHTVHAPSLTIEVKPLPSKPAGFSGAVGSGFTLSAQLLTANPRENETLTLRLRIHGTGNIDLVTPPTVAFPSDFETFDPQTKANTRLTTAGMEGDLIVDYPAIPNHKGQFTIPRINFIFFNPQDGKYHTISTDKPIVVNVAKGSPNSYAARQRMRNDDIANIHLNPLRTHSVSVFWGRPLFWILYAVVIIAFAIAYYLLLLRRRLYADETGQNRRKAGRRAASRLKKAASYLHKGQGQDFYTETLTALRQFVADKTSIPAPELTKERITTVLSEHQVPQDLIDRLTGLMSDCELHIYGVSDDSPQDMRSVLDQAEQLLSQLNPLLKKKKK